MGGCCCCSSRSAASDRTPTYFYCPQDLEGHEPLSGISSGLLIDTNLDTSTPDTYQAPPVPLPYDSDLASSQTLPRDVESCGNKTDHIQLANSRTTEESADLFETSGCKDKTESGHNSPKITEDDVIKSIVSTAEEDVCPICLEEYDSDNPRIMTKCEHHFHLSCIFEWMERSDTCAICDKIMMIDQTYTMLPVSN